MWVPGESGGMAKCSFALTVCCFLPAGEAYRATDTKLGREVAIKVLAPNVSPSKLEPFV
jgi:hypothetical protein